LKGGTDFCLGRREKGTGGVEYEREGSIGGREGEGERETFVRPAGGRELQVG